jgi:inactivated superfamily I helicase
MNSTIGWIKMRKTIILIAALLLPASAASAQVELAKYANADGYIDVQQLTCGQLANTYQEDADFLGVWYSGWYNGLAKKHAINVRRVKEQIHNVIVYCKANRSKRIIQAIDIVLKQEQQQKR